MARRRAVPCEKCGAAMRRLYIHQGVSRKQRTLGVAWACLNCKTIVWDFPVKKEGIA